MIFDSSAVIFYANFIPIQRQVATSYKDQRVDMHKGVNSILTLGGCQRLSPCETGNCPAKNEVYNIR